MSCVEYQALPPNMRNVEDNMLRKLARDKNWRSCPGCDMMVERIEGGCNHMQCTCGVAFCYMYVPGMDFSANENPN